MVLFVIALVMVSTILAVTFMIIDNNIESEIVRMHIKAFILLVALTLALAYQGGL